MNIGGPFLDRQRREAKCPWYLSYFVPKMGTDGTPVMIDGKVVMRRERPYYPSKAAAMADKPRIEAQHATAGAGSFVQSREAQAEYERAKAIVPNVSLVSVAQYYAKHHPATGALLLEDAISKCVEDAKRRLGETAHWKDLKTRLPKFGAVYPGRNVASITRAEVMAYLLSIRRGPRSVLNYKRAVCNLFNWLIGEGLLDVNPAAGIKRKKLPKIIRKEIVFLKLEEATAYLRALERYDPELVAHEIIQLFSGVRADDEMSDFRGEWVFPETHEILIPESAAKTGVREVINELEPVFWDWWKAYGRAGVLRPKNYPKRWSRIRFLATLPREEADAAAVFPIKRLLKLPAVKAVVRAWPWNARRRTFCTYHVAKHQSADKTKLILRHNGDAYTLHKSYRGLGVTQAMGQKYFEEKPQPCPSPIRPLPPVRKRNAQALAA